MDQAKPTIERSREYAELAPILVNGKKVELDEPDPTVAEVCRAAHHDPKRVQVYLLRGAEDKQGAAIEMTRRLHRADRAIPIYLRCVEKDPKEKEASIAPSMTSHPEDDQGRQLTIPDVAGPAPFTPQPPPEPPGPLPH